MAVVNSTERTTYLTVAKGVTLAATWTAFLDMVQPWVERAVSEVVGYSLEQATYTEFLPVTGGEAAQVEFGIDVRYDVVGGVAVPISRLDPANSYITLSRLPARSLVSVYENPSAWMTGAADGNWPASSLLPNTVYRLDFSEPGLCTNGRLIKTTGTWCSIPRTVKVTYTYGYSAGELSGDYGTIKLAVLEGLAFWLQRGLRSSQALKANGYAAVNVAIRDFSAGLADPSTLGAGAGVWAANMLGPSSMAILMKRVNMAQYLG